MKLGVVACLHGNLKKTKKAAKVFKKADVDAIVLAGDIPADTKQSKSLIKILKIFSKTKKKVYILPGSHEHYKEYYSALKKFKKNKFVIDCTKTNSTIINSQKIVFLPGADATAPGAGFRAIKDRKSLKLFKRHVKQHKEHFWGKITAYYISDLNKLLDKQSILIAHFPPEFKTKSAIDLATFGTPKKPFILLERHRELNKTTVGLVKMTPEHVVFTIDEAKRLIKAGYPVKIKGENVGNPYLKKLIKKRKVRFFICSHIHESGGRANNLKGKPVKQGKWSKELFYNCSGRAGIVEFKNNLAMYRSVRV